MRRPFKEGAPRAVDGAHGRSTSAPRSKQAKAFLTLPAQHAERRAICASRGFIVRADKGARTVGRAR